MNSSGPRYAELVAAEVRGAAAKKRVTGRELAEAIGVSPQSMSRRMTGALPFDVAELADVADLLGCSVADLLPRARQVTREYRSWTLAA